MNKLVKLMAACALVIPMAGFADDHKVAKKIIISDDGKGMEEIHEILRDVDIEIDDHENVSVFVTKGEDGEVRVEKFEGKMGGRWAPMVDGDGPHRVHMMKRGMPGLHRAKSPMTRDAANCVLKNIKNAATEQSAKAITRACRVLNPPPVEESQE